MGDAAVAIVATLCIVFLCWAIVRAGEIITGWGGKR